MKGYLPHKTIKCVVFWIMVVCLAATTGSGILRAWGGLQPDAANRLFQSAGILAFGSGLFLILNLIFGDFGKYVFGPSRQAPNMDPAFAERLKKAKVSSEEETRSKSD